MQSWRRAAAVSHSVVRPGWLQGQGQGPGVPRWPFQWTPGEQRGQSSPWGTVGSQDSVSLQASAGDVGPHVCVTAACGQHCWPSEPSPPASGLLLLQRRPGVSRTFTPQVTGGDGWEREPGSPRSESGRMRLTGDPRADTPRAEGRCPPHKAPRDGRVWAVVPTSPPQHVAAACTADLRDTDLLSALSIKASAAAKPT